jgi:hypothetical protein
VKLSATAASRGSRLDSSWLAGAPRSSRLDAAPRSERRRSPLPSGDGASSSHGLHGAGLSQRSPLPRPSAASWIDAGVAASAPARAQARPLPLRRCGRSPPRSIMSASASWAGVMIRGTYARSARVAMPNDIGALPHRARRPRLARRARHARARQAELQNFCACRVASNGERQAHSSLLSPGQLAARRETRQAAAAHDPLDDVLAVRIALETPAFPAVLSCSHDCQRLCWIERERGEKKGEILRQHPDSTGCSFPSSTAHLSRSTMRFSHGERDYMAPGGVEPPHADSKSAALSTELRGRVCQSSAVEP